MSKVFYEVYYHIVWATKKRLDLINNETEKIIINTIGKKTKELGAVMIAINTYIDHCHLLVSIPPSLSISDFVGQIKGLSAHEVNKQTDIEVFKWQRGYGVISLSKRGLPFVKNYILNQKEYHRNKANFLDILEFIPEE